jgi:pimeloyl-ACP methyl ester carboxylesterase
MLFFLRHGYRVIAHDRRGHGRSTQGSDGYDMDHYTDDLAALTAHLDLKNAIHVGHSTGGGEVARYLGRHGESRVAKAVLISAVPPLMRLRAALWRQWKTPRRRRAALGTGGVVLATGCREAKGPIGRSRGADYARVIIRRCRTSPPNAPVRQTSLLNDFTPSQFCSGLIFLALVGSESAGRSPAALTGATVTQRYCRRFLPFSQNFVIG